MKTSQFFWVYWKRAGGELIRVSGFESLERAIAHVEKTRAASVLDRAYEIKAGDTIDAATVWESGASK